MQAVLRINTRSYKCADVKSNTKCEGRFQCIVFSSIFQSSKVKIFQHSLSQLNQSPLHVGQDLLFQ